MKSFTIILATITMMAAATVAHAATDSKTKDVAAQSPASVECSKQADAKGLHGKERKTFRAKCKKETKAKASTTRSGTPAAAAPNTATPPSTKKY